MTLGLLYALGFGTVLAGVLIALSWIDIRTYRLPDYLTLPLAGLGVLQYWLVTGGVRDSLIGAAAGYVIFVGIAFAFAKLRGKEGLGRGDAKLLAAGGAWCGWMGLSFIVLVASAFGLVFALLSGQAKSKSSGWIPFGPFLALGIFMVWTATRLSAGG